MKKPHGYTVLALSLSLALNSCNKPSEEDARSAEEIAAEEALAAELEAEEAERVAKRKAQKANLDAIMAKMRKDDESVAKVSGSQSEGTAGEKKPEETSEDPGSAVSEAEWLEIEERLVARGASNGLNLGTLKTTDGRSFDEAVVQAADALGITIYHRAGVDQLGYELLSPQLQERFRYDPEEAKRIAEGLRTPPLPIERRRAVQRRINAALIAAAQADSAAYEASLEARSAEEKAAAAAAAEAGQTKAADARARHLSLDKELEAARHRLDRALQTLAQLEAEADFIRHGPKDVNIRRAGVDTPQTRAADEKVKNQKKTIVALEAKLKKLEAERFKR